LLGDFRVFKAGQPISVRGGGKGESLLCYLAARHPQGVARDTLASALWPDVDLALGITSLNSLLHRLNRLLTGEKGNVPAIVQFDSVYNLNIQAGVGVDIDWFTALARTGEQQMRLGDHVAALQTYRRAVDLYQGDLCSCAGFDTQAMLEREHVRAVYLTLLGRLADYAFQEADYTTCLDYTRRVLKSEPCREDAHRRLMRCYARRGERAQAFRQYLLCQTILKTEWNTEPEPETKALFEQIRQDPGSV
jgi:DNA-binding SARP family transcriptional activator